jgi:surfeit locus 1 family protein
MMRRLPIVPTVIVLLAVATMIGLGFWQLQRKGQKEHLLARYAAALTDPAPVVFPVAGDGTAVLYRRAAFDCRVEPGLWDSVAGRNAAGEGAMSTSPIAWRRAACPRWSSLAGRAIRTRRNGMVAG